MGDVLAAFRHYLQSHFPGAEIRQDGSQFEIEKDGNTYSLKVLEEVVNENYDLTSLLSSSNLKDELCRAEGLPLLVTSNGIRLSSSN